MVAGASASSRDAISERQATTQSLLRLRAALRSDLIQTATRRPRDINGRKPQGALVGALSGGEGVFLSLVRRGWDNPLQESRASLQYVEYQLVDGRIERLWRRHVDGSPMQAPQVLLHGVESADLDFLDWDQWADAWTGAPNRPLPRAIRLNLRLAGQGDLSQTFLLPEVAS
jgi:general secretion pathway protein J